MKKLSLAALALSAATAFATDFYEGTVFHPIDGWDVNHEQHAYEGVAVTLNYNDSIRTEVTGSSGGFKFPISDVSNRGAVQKNMIGSLAIAGNKLSFEGVELQKMIISDAAGRRLFQRDIGVNERFVELPQFATGYRIISLIEKSGKQHVTPWISGLALKQPLYGSVQPSMKTTASRADIPTFPDTVTFTSPLYPEIKLPINIDEGLFPIDVILHDHQYGLNDPVSLISYENYGDTVIYDTLLHGHSEDIVFIECDMSNEYLIAGEKSYTQIIKDERVSNSFFTLDLDTVEFWQTSVYGTVILEEMYSDPMAPFPIATFNLCYPYSGFEVALINAANTDDVRTVATLENGRYFFENVPDGDYFISIPNFDDGFEGKARVAFSTDSTRKIDMKGPFYFMAVAPNIYLYPEDTTNVSVQVEVRDGGSIPYSIPTYNDGWNVTAAPDGRINDSLGFLYYDFYSGIPYQSDSGWVIDYDNFDSEITDLLSTRGLNGQEIFDFIDFWKPKIDSCDWVTFCPIDAGKMVELRVDPEPVTLFRELYLVLPATGEKPTIKEPARGTPFKREGFTVVEWGGHLKSLKLTDVIK